MDSEYVQYLLQAISAEVTELDELDLEIKKLENDRDRAIAEVRKEFNAQIEPLKQKQRKIAQEKVYEPVAQKHRSKLLEAMDSKTFKLPAGTLRLYLSPNPRLVKGAEEEVLAELKRKGLMRTFTTRNVVVQWEKMKRWILAGNVKLSTVSVEQPEFFKITLKRSHTDLSFDEKGTFTREVKKK